MRKICVMLLLLFVGTFVFAPQALAKKYDPVPGEILVKFKDITPPGIADEELKKVKIKKIISKIEGINTLVISVPEKTEQKIIDALSKNPLVEYAESNFVAEALLTPNDTYFADRQWGLENTGQIIQMQVGVADADIDASSAWDITTGNAGIKVAVLDTGIDQNHEDLQPKIVVNKNFSWSVTVDDLYGHGTHVGGIVAAVTNNGIGVAGGCPSCTLMNVKVLDDTGSGAYSWIANGIIWATNNGAKVINMSLGGTAPSKTLEKAINYAAGKNVVIVAAAGNAGNQTKVYPGAYPKVIAVAATDNQDKKASFSTYGSWVDVAAPGVNIFSTFPNHPYVINKSLNYDFASGTSMATPMTSAVVALIWSTPFGTSATNVRARLESTADPISGTGLYWTAGRINATKAVNP